MASNNEGYTILVVEDNAKHLADVKTLLDQRRDLVRASYVSDLEAAIRSLDANRYDGILSDAHFPERAGSIEAPCGVQIIDYAMDHKMPFTIVTSTYHHAKKTEAIHERAMASGASIIDDASRSKEPNYEHETKRWEEGLASMIYLIDKHRSGELQYRTIEWSGKTGMVESKEEMPIASTMPPYEKNALDEVKQRLRL